MQSTELFPCKAKYILCLITIISVSFIKVKSAESVFIDT